MCCRCLRIEKFCCCFSLTAGCILIGWYLSLEAFLLLIASIAWVSETSKYEGGDAWEKAAYAVAGWWLLGTSISIIVGVDKGKANYLKFASVSMVIPIILLAVDSMIIFFYSDRRPKLFANVVPMVLMPYFIVILCSKAVDLEEKRRGYVSGRESQMVVS